LYRFCQNHEIYLGSQIVQETLSGHYFRGDTALPGDGPTWKYSGFLSVLDKVAPERRTRVLVRELLLALVVPPG